MKSETSEQGSNTFLYSVIGLIAIIIVTIAFFRNRPTPADPRAATLAACLTEKGLKFYGASWCSHCAEQKAKFGDAVSKLPYIECANQDNSQNETCNKAGIETYPTWMTPDGKKHVGVLTFEELASLSSCPL